MKIAFIVGKFPVLSETFILNQITGLIDRGHEVDIYAEQVGDLTKLHEDVINYQLLNRVHYFPEIPTNLVWRVFKAGGVFARNFVQSAQDTLRAINVIKYGKSALSLWLLYSVIPNFNQEYDIIHCQFGTFSFRGLAFRTINSSNAKLITIFRGHDISRFVQEKGKNVYADVFEKGDYFLANCDFFKSRVIQLGCPPQKIKVHFSGLNCNKFIFKPRFLKQGETIRIATTGRLVEKKGIEYSIKAVAKQAKITPNLEYKIIGDGELKSDFEQLIQALKMQDRIELVGWKNEQEIKKILDNSHIFIAPSVTAKDGNQDAPINVLKEAMAMGLPVISTYHGGIPELVEDGVSGFLVPERDIDSLADKLNLLIQHPEKWSDMGKAGRNYVEKHYDLVKLNDQLVTVYGKLLEIP